MSDVRAEGRAATPNRLARESSPYLLQHRFNPVDWWAWGPDAFAEARRLDRPIFLSIGYSTCYWCHVMERESFESESIAAMLNQSFVCIKVDREERPDVDDVYMAAVQAFTGHGGWPMSLFLEPLSLRPFFAGTYFPAVEKPGYGVPSFPQVIDSMSRAWREQRDDVLAQAEELADAVRERVSVAVAPRRVGQAHVGDAVAQALRMADRQFGGFGTAPKFPQAPLLDLLLSVRPAAGDDATRAAIDAALRTSLDAMALGGLFDQIGGGFHRYSVDARWIVPHFEKMLYDNAMLAALYARAAAEYHDPFYQRIADLTVQYLLREMTFGENDQRLAYFSAQDAEVDHREGLNYLWTREQLLSVLGEEDGAWASRVLGVDTGPNFRDPHHPNDPPCNVLHLSKRPEEWAGQPGLNDDYAVLPISDGTGGSVSPVQSSELIDSRGQPSPTPAADRPQTSAFLARLDRVRARLLDARAKRKQPGTDDKVLTAWNALAIAALVDVARTQAEPAARTLLAHAERVAEFLLTRVRTADTGELARSWRRDENGHATCGVPAVLEDYAMLVRALVAIAGATSDSDRRDQWINAAWSLLRDAQRHFASDSPSAALIWFDTASGRDDLFVRPMSVFDGAVPGATGVMLNALVDLALAARTPSEREEALHLASRSLRGVSGFIARSPLGAATCTLGLFRLMRLDRSAYDAAWMGLQGALLAPSDADDSINDSRSDPAQRSGAPDDVVEVLSSVERVTVSRDVPALVPLRLRIKPGYHLTAAIPSTDPRAAEALGAIGLRVHVINGTGIRAFADYPPGGPWGNTVDSPQSANSPETKAESTPKAPPSLLAYEGEVDLEVVVERDGDWSGRPLLAITFQACTDRACLRPRTVELDVAIDRE